MRLPIIGPASAACFQACPFNTCCFNLKVAFYNRYLIVAVFLILRTQNIFIDPYRLFCIGSDVIYFSKIALCNQSVYFTFERGIFFIKIF